jgi:hypothetical protein
MALSVLALSACGSDPLAAFEGDKSSDGGGEAATTTPSLPQVDPGFYLEEVEEGAVTTTQTLQPQKSTIITPTGTLAVTGLFEVTSAAADVLGITGQSDDGDGNAHEYAAAQDQVFRLVELAFTAAGTDDEDFWSADQDEDPASALSISIGGAQTHLADLTDGYTNRLLVSAAQDGTTTLVVSCEGHDQMIDVATGERADDPVTTVYYRSTTMQEPHHTFTIDPQDFAIKTSYGDDETVTVDLSYQITALSLVAWVKDKGWAEEGKAWLQVEWTSTNKVTNTNNMDAGEIKEISANLAVTVDGETTEDELFLEDQYNSSGSDDTVTTIVPVPADMTGATVSVSGNYTVDLQWGGSDSKIDGSKDHDFTTKELEVDFPDDGSGAGPDPSDAGGAADAPSDGGS